jgi:formylglycine-generating enzyme required for sulfatase activity
LAQQTEDSITLPIFVPLSAYAQERRKRSAARERTLAAFITHYLIEKQSGLNLPANFFTRLLDRGHSVILLLDGLDEVPDDQERAAVREAIENLVTGRENMRVVVTCRTAAYRGRTALGRDFREVQVESLDDKHIANLVRQAYKAVYANDPTLRQTKTNELLRGISDLEAERRQRLGENVERLVDSPLLVRMLLVVHLSQRRLPEHRAELYMRATDTMLLPEHTLDEETAQYIGRLVGGTHERHRELVQHLAFAMHRRGAYQGRELEEADVRQVLGEIPEFVPLIEDFLTLTRLRGTLLEERMDVYRFIHLAFQEYLAARYLAEVKRSEGGVEAIARFLEEGPIGEVWWREPALLVVGYLTLTAPRAASQLLRRLVGIVQGGETQPPPTPDVRLVAAQLAMTAYIEWLSTDSTLHRELAEGIVALMGNVDLARYSQPRLRAELGDALAQFGDPRFAADAWYLPAEPLLGFIEIPAGPFTMGRNPAVEEDVEAWEHPPHEVSLPMYYVARYPVTVAQFRAFCEATGYQPKNPDGLRDPPTRPVRYVSWQEALRYCMWLTETLRVWEKTPEPLATLLRTGTDGSPPWRITLPSEAEWEKAARGRDGRIYPWGNDPNRNAANCRETGLNTTSAMGCFPNGASPYGVEELAGNVWEWTRTLWGKDYSKPNFGYPYNPTDGREDLKASDRVLRVMRGGTYYSEAGAVGCGARVSRSPNYWYINFGFRVVASPLPLETG